ncbi:hypothetical protein [Sinisalibacter lacisalsi]|uniref:hypothetical protein n=1 Tax=Sinisalibacter lacisalsi TaxID=1526570 RepID=UPI001668464D|nr:hypothetical protein [Sinisalibacter lacisalsi]
MAEYVSSKVLITVKPGPVLHVWRDGVEVARVPLTKPYALGVMHDLLEHIRWPQ